MVAKYLRVSLVALTILGMSTGAFPQNATRPIPREQAVIRFIPERSRIDFTLLGFPHITHGSFKLASGIVRIDPATERIDGEIAINADSGDTGGGMRDREMKKSVLEVDRYPRISFAPQKIERHGDPHGTFPVRVRGLLLIHGGEHEFPIDATVIARGDEVTINSRFTVPYVAWGLRDPSIFVFRVNKTVDLDVTLVGRVSWAIPTAALIGTRR